MSTRGFITFVVDGAEKTCYIHDNAYPGAAGLDTLNWLRREHHGFAERQARNLRPVDDNVPPAPADVDRLAPYTDLTVSKRSTADWYCLLRRTHGNPAAILDAGWFEPADDFPADSLYAEYGYVIDFDTKVLEAYVGFQEAPHNRGRFAGRTTQFGANGYHAVALAASWTLSALPSDDEFVAAIEPDVDNEAA